VKDTVTTHSKLLSYKDHGPERVIAASRSARAQFKEKWEGPFEIGLGWQGFKKVIALLRVASVPIVR
jgi:hypothetical protein